MALTLEQLALQIYKECLADGEEVTKEQALEMAEMEIKAKGIKNYVKSNNSKTEEKPKRKTKLDNEKVEIINFLNSILLEKFDNVEVKNPQKEITFNINDNNYSISLIKHKCGKSV